MKEGKITGKSITASIVGKDIPTFEDQIRQIVREEIAAHKEQLKIKPDDVARSAVDSLTSSKPYYGTTI